MKLLSPSLSMGLLSAALVMGASTQAAAQEYTFTTFAGPPELGPGDADGPGSLARFSWPHGVAVDGAGNVYVSDSIKHTIRKVSPAGVVSTLAGLAGSSGSADGRGSAARFYYPAGVAVDSTGNVYVADAFSNDDTNNNNTIRKITPAGVVTTLAGLAGSSGSADGTGSAARFYSPQGVAVDSAGNVYVADMRNHTIRNVTPAGAVSTLAGLAGSPGSADGTGSAARFDCPMGVAVDSAGNLYVADGFTTIRKVTPAGVVTTLAGLAGSPGSADGTGSAARFNSPKSVAVDSADNVYVADMGNYTIRKVTAVGVVTTLAGLARNYGSADGTGSAARFDLPQGVAVDSSDNVYVADHNTIRKITPTGVVTTLAGAAASWGSANGMGSAARFFMPEAAAVDSAGNVYVADMRNHTIRKITPAGDVTTLAGAAASWGSANGMGSAARFNNPYGVAADSAGNVYVADTRNHTIRKVTPGGVVRTLAGLAGTSGSNDGTGSAARFECPWGVAVDSAGNVYVADSENHTLRKVTPAGVVTTLAGLAGNSGSADGTGSNAQFNYPTGVAVDSAGNVYVADHYNHTIRKVTPNGVVTTLAGSEFGSADGTGSDAQFSYPCGVAVDSAGNIYVTDSSMIRKVTPGGLVTTLAGLAYGSADGTGSDACFSVPGGVAADSAGNLYVADTSIHTIRLGRPACPDAPAIDLVTGPVGQARQLDTRPQTAVAWQWRLVRIPAGSALALWTANVRNPTFTPDVAELFIFRLTATDAAGSISIRTLALTAVPGPPVFQPVTLTQGTLELTWSTEAGARYQLQCNSDVNSTNWTSLVGPLTATGTTLSTIDYATNGAARFYRAVRLPGGH